MMRGFMLLSLCLSFTASAGIEGKLLNMFNKMGFSGHANAGKAYLDQSGG